MTEQAKRKEAQLMKLIEPKFLSIVESPANKTGFKVLRSAQGDQITAISRNRRKKRNDGSLLSIDLPYGTTESEANDLMISFGMESDYMLMSDGSGNYYLRRKDAEDVETTQIELGNGYSANIASEAFVARSDNAITGVTLVGLELDSFKTVEEVQGWLDGKKVNYKPEGIEIFDGGAVVTRHDTPKDQEVRKVRISDSVVGLVTRTEHTDVPELVYRAIIEQAYGQWGWGHLNFATAMADPEFTDKSWDAIDFLQDVLENIILYSGLPLDERKTLVQNATSDFTSYIVSLMDALPREVMEQARADRNDNQETSNMSKVNEDQKAKRDDSAPADDVKAENVKRDDKVEDKSTEASEDKQEFVTRDDIKEVVAEAMREALAPAEDVKREDEVKEDPVMAELKAMRKDFGDKLDSLESKNTSLKEEIDELGGETVARSYTDDTSVNEDGIKRSDSPFVGMFKGQL